MSKLTEKQQSIVDVYLILFEELGRIPVAKDLREAGISRETVRHHFQSYNSLDEAAREINKNIPEKKENETRKNLIEAYTELVKNVKAFPTKEDLYSKGFTVEHIRHHFRNLENLRKASMDLYPDTFKGSMKEADLNKKHKELLSLVKGKKEFIITTAVSGQRAFSEAIYTIKNWKRQYSDREIIILPSLDTAHNLDNEMEWFFGEEILDLPMAFGEVKLNSNFHISDFPVTAKQVNPITGIGSVIQGKGSMVFASPKQSLEFESVSSGAKYPHAGMSTGSITLANYKSSRGNSQRSAWIAEKHHKLGAILVEIQDNKTYHFRQIQFNESGGFNDMGLYYEGDKIMLSESRAKTKEQRPIMVRGDYHAGHHDEDAVRGSELIAKLAGIKTVYDHDFADHSVLNHHEEGNLVSALRKLESKKFKDAMSEMEVVGQEIVRAMETFETQNIIDSNHHDFLIKWAQKGEFFKKEPHHFDLGSLVIQECRAGRNPLIAVLRKYGKIPNFDKLIKSGRLVFLTRKQDKVYEGLNVGAHGDLGRNGKRNPNKAGLEKGYGRGIFGHSHTSGILRDIVQVGCLEVLRPGYNQGPSGWIHNVALAYPDGQVQLVNIIFGEYARKESIERIKKTRQNILKKKK